MQTSNIEVFHPKYEVLPIKDTSISGTKGLILQGVAEDHPVSYPVHPGGGKTAGA
jgi:hypothetical protein